MQAAPLLSLLIWLPMLGGALCLMAGNSASAAGALAGAGDRAGRRCVLSIPLFTGFDMANAGMQFVEQHAVDPDLRHPATTSASTASRCALIGLTTLTTVLVLIGAWGSIDKRVSQYWPRS